MLVQHHKTKNITPSLGCLTIFIVHGHLDNAWYKKAHYRLQTKLRKGNVFTSVCQEFCSQGGGVHHAPWADTPPGQTHPEQTPPRTDTPRQTATAVDGTHPTGMHSCFTIFASNKLK